MAPTTVLMYHALTDASGACEHADPHYAVSAAALDRHLAMMREAGVRPSSLERLLQDPVPGGSVALTFDDGHASNAAAAERILAAGASADFFVNPARVGAPGYLGWTALADLARAGISIQSHGLTHRYFNELDEAELERELAESKARIEERLGRPVTLLAPPGGRMTARVAPIAERLGYRALCCSRAGVWDARRESRWAIPRLAVLNATSDAQMRRWIRQDRLELLRMGMRHHLLAGAKRVLGNRGYERLRARLL